jgi:hypothetical protein
MSKISDIKQITALKVHQWIPAWNEVKDLQSRTACLPNRVAMDHLAAPKTFPIRVPCVRTKMGGFNTYSFPISPEYLLKISYVSHRSKGKASDVHTYQRMLAKSRLNKIRQYISDAGIFPTNIVVNLEKKRLTFERIKQEHNKDEQDESGVLGWLDIRPAYKSAWTIGDLLTIGVVTLLSSRSCPRCDASSGGDW